MPYPDFGIRTAWDRGLPTTRRFESVAYNQHTRSYNFPLALPTRDIEANGVGANYTHDGLAD